ncbi:DUF4397 domain-containing protein [Dinghuibacter silviterrae]|uniref:Uncharacterized protein DUF4397 n=1 Tax=Dinghuibacter silviterrae TaxID=1539049 RepID=A0A4R8DMC8_9BACT|nr:DUF4397 domain-containing protein [Dinghuibacter silviterrae]TDW99131.1 uncharacterized protein DUF4397 [Dinghuibacter silviterrae]
MMKRLLSFACLLLFFGSCLKTPSNTNNSNQQYAYISFLHLAYYSPAAELYFNDSLASTLLNPLQFSGSYGHFYPVTYDVKFKTSTGTVLGDIPSSAYDTAQFYTLLLYNDSVNGSAKVVKIQDDFSAVASGQAYYRFFNMSPSAGAVDLYLAGNKVQSARTPADNITQPDFNAFNAYAYGYYTVTVKKAGTDTTLGSASQVGFQSGVAYTIFIDGPKDSLYLNVLTAQY